MKKLLALLMAVALCMGLLAGVAMAEDENLASAKGLLDFMYKSKSRDKLTVTAEDYTVINQLMIDGVVYPVTWAVDLDTIQVQPAEDGKYTIVLDKANAKETTYTLTATVTAPDGSTLDVAYQRVMPAMLLEMSYADIVNAAYTLEDGAAMSKTQRLFGTVTAINTAWSDEYKNITVTIQVGDLADKTIQCYRLSGEGADKLAVGDAITVEGTIKNYKGTIEFDKGCQLVGFGDIGRKIATRLKGFGTTILAYDPYCTKESIEAFGCVPVSLDELLEQADFVSLHVRLSPQTQNMFGAAEFAKMKPTAIFVNAARAGLVDEAAMIDALEQKKIGGAVLDVFREEPLPVDHPLRKLKNVTLSAHLAGTDIGTFSGSIKIVADNLEQYFSGGELKNVVNH